MKKHVAVSVSLLVVIAIASLIPGRAQSAGTPTAHPPGNGAPPANPLKVALLKWYAANTTTSFKVGKEPIGVAFDGQNIWTANSGDGTLTKLRASDGERLGEFVCGAGYGVAFDGANIWATRIDNKVVKVRASDGKVLGTYDAGTSPFWLAFDGANIRVANFGVGTGSVTELRASDGKTLGTFKVDAAPIAEQLIATDLPVKAIAAELGYRNAFDLTRSFEKRYLVTPTKIPQRQPAKAQVSRSILNLLRPPT